MKKMKDQLLKRVLVIGLISLVMVGCRKKDEPDKDTGTASDNALAEGTFNDVSNIADEAASGTMDSYKVGSDASILGNCATISFTSTATDTTMTIDFGTVNCLCKDGRYRRGKIMVTWSGAYKDAGHVHTITFDNYFVNNNQVLGSKTVTNTGLNNAGNISYDISVNGTVILSNGKTVTWTSQRVREFIEGSATTTRFDDVYLVTGSANGSTSQGHSFTATIINPVRIEVACHYIVSGTIEFSPSGKAMRTIDFGSGACDALATVTINGNTYNITLK